MRNIFLLVICFLVALNVCAGTDVASPDWSVSLNFLSGKPTKVNAFNFKETKFAVYFEDKKVVTIDLTSFPYRSPSYAILPIKDAISYLSFSREDDRSFDLTEGAKLAVTNKEGEVKIFYGDELEKFVRYGDGSAQYVGAWFLKDGLATITSKAMLTVPGNFTKQLKPGCTFNSIQWSDDGKVIGIDYQDYDGPRTHFAMKIDDQSREVRSDFSLDTIRSPYNIHLRHDGKQFAAPTFLTKNYKGAGIEGEANVERWNSSRFPIHWLSIVADKIQMIDENGRIAAEVKVKNAYEFDEIIALGKRWLVTIGKNGNTYGNYLIHFWSLDRIAPLFTSAHLKRHSKFKATF